MYFRKSDKIKAKRRLHILIQTLLHKIILTEIGIIYILLPHYLLYLLLS